MRIREVGPIATIVFAITALAVATSAHAYYFQNLRISVTYPTTADTITGGTNADVTGTPNWIGPLATQMYVKVAMESFDGDTTETTFGKVDMTFADQDCDGVN